MIIHCLQRLLLTCLLIILPAMARADHPAQTDAQLTAVAEQLEARLNSKRYLLEAVSQLVREQPDISAEAFETIARQMYSGNRDLLAIQLAKNQVISHVYPRTGNKATLGHDLLADPKRQQQTRNAITHKSASLAGPYQLRQGGTGIILRQPVFLDKAQTKNWGLAIVVIDWQRILQQIDIPDSHDNLQLAVRNVSEPGNTETYGDQALFADPFSYQRTLNLPNSSWQIALKAETRASDHTPQTLLIVSLASGGILLTLFGVLMRRRNSWHSPAGLSLALLLLCSAGLVAYTDTRTQNQTLRAAQAMDEIRQRIYQRLRDNQNYQRLLIDEYLQGRLSPQQFRERGRRFVEDHPELMNFNQVDTQLVITNVTPRKGNDQILGLTISLEAPLAAALLARETHSPAYTRLFQNIQGRYSFESWLPIYRGNQFEGLIAAVYDVEKLLQMTVPAALLETYEVSIADRPQASQPMADKLSRALAQPGQGATLYLSVRDPVSNGQHTLLLVASLLLALGLFGVFRKLQRSNAKLEHRYAQLSAARDALYREKEYSQTTLAAISDGVITLDQRGRITHLNPCAEHFLQLPLFRANGQVLTDLLRLQTAEDSVDRLPQMIEQTLSGQRPEQMDGQLQHPSGPIALHCNASPITLSGRVEGAVVVLHDVTRLTDMASRLSYQASHDSLTGLINRTEFEQRCTQALHQGGHHLLYMDLDQFKLVNDTCGHLAGDQLLVELSALLQKQLHEDDTLARLGGDEFGLLLPNTVQPSVYARAEQIRTTVKEFRFVWQDKIFELGCSIGMVPLHAQDGPYSSALARADMACYIAKDSGRNRIHLFTDTDQQASQRKGEMSWASRLTAALEQQRLVLFQQPIVAIDEQGPQPLRFEVLLRLYDEEGTLIPPGAFLPAAERYQLISALDQRVIEQTLSFLEQRPDILAALDCCSINLSGQSISDPGFISAIQTRLQNSPVPGEKICFEITETAAIANLAHASTFIEQLRTMGIRFALDDFGSGMASFGYLKELPVDYLKIDGSFVRDIASDPQDRAFVEAIHNIGRSMGMHTVAEFIEDDEIFEILRQIGVDYGQGYGLARPAPLEELSLSAKEPGGNTIENY